VITSIGRNIFPNSNYALCFYFESMILYICFRFIINQIW